MIKWNQYICTLKTSFRCFKCRGRTSWPPPDDLTEFSELLLLLLTLLTLLPMTELLALLLGLRLTVPWLELELGVGLCGPAFLSSLLAVSEEVDPELTPDELWITKLGGPPPPLMGLRPSERLRRPDREWAITEPAQEWLLIEPPLRLALSKHSEEAKMLALTLCLLPSRTET